MRLILRRARDLAILASLLASASSCGDGDGTASGPTPGHARMVVALAEIATRTAEENTFLGDRMAVDLRKLLAALPPNAALDQRFRLNLDLGREELRIGRTEEAIGHLEEASKLALELPEPARKEAAIFAAACLGMAHLRWAETRNCVTRHTEDSCIIPIRGGGIHVDKQPSRDAIAVFTDVIELAGDRWERFPVMWLLNVAYMTVGEYPDGVPESLRIPPEIFAAHPEFPRFTNVGTQVGIDIFDLSGGAVAEDFDGDGLLDLFTSTWEPGGLAHLLIRQPDGSFMERTSEAGLDGITGGLNVVQADYDNDGDIDLYVLRGAWFEGTGRHPNSLLRNDGGATFTDVTFDAGLGEEHYPTQTAAWADYDNDGDLDLYVGNESTPNLGYPSQLFRNDGRGRFADVAAEAGVQNLRYAKAVIWGDYDNDRFPDLYVSNLRGPNRLYHNNGDGTFTDVAAESGVAQPIDSFPVWFWDYDNDGALDLYVATYFSGASLTRLYAVVADYLDLDQPAEAPALYRGDGRGGFRDVAEETNVAHVSMTMGANFGDLDGDGYPDFYLGTGYPSYFGVTPNVMYWNRGGKRFVDVTSAGGFGHLQKGHGISFADLDNDGDQDVFQQMGGAFPGDAFGNVLYENPGFGRHWITVKLQGVQSNRSAIGARIKAVVIEDGQPRTIYKHVNSGGSFGCNPLTQQIGLGRAERLETLEIYWPTSDRTQLFHDLEMDRLVEIVEDRDEPRVTTMTPLPLKKF